MTDERFETRAVHAGERRPAHDNGQGGEYYPISTPIYASSTFSHPDIASTDRVLGGEEPGYSYARYNNPTVAAYEEAISALEAPEGGARTLAFASGMAAMHAALSAAEATGECTVVAAEQLYGSTATLLLQIFGPTGVEPRFVDIYDLRGFAGVVEECSPRAVVVETISNPLLRVADVPALAEIARANGAALIVDNTFGTPYLQRSLEMGADIVVHSATKFLSGHGDLTGGLVIARPPYDAGVEQVRKLVGGVPGPFDCWLAMRGLKTLALRMERQCHNAREVAARLAGHPKVEKVNHPSLESHPDRALAGRMLADTGALISFDLAGAGREEAFRFLDALELCVRAPSLGDIYTLAIHPASSSHRDLPPSRRERLGVGEGLIRLSCGIEHHEDLARDLEKALEAL